MQGVLLDFKLNECLCNNNKKIAKPSEELSVATCPRCGANVKIVGKVGTCIYCDSNVSAK